MVFKKGVRRIRFRRSKKKMVKVQKRYFGKTRDSVFRKIETEFPVYAVQDTAGTARYSWDVASTPNAFLYNRDFAANSSAGTGLWKTDEFVNLMRSNVFCCIKGFSISFVRSSLAFNTTITPFPIQFTSLPAIYFSPLFDTPPATAVDNDTACGTDGALIVSIITTAPTGLSKYYALPPNVSLAGGYSYGALTYTNAYQMYNTPGNYSFEVAVGSASAPVSMITAPTAVVALLGTVKVTAYCEFAVGWSTALAWAP